jgi:hypothetical protein
MDVILNTLGFIFDSARDVFPIAVFLFVFQRLVIGKPLANRRQIAVGFVFVVVGLGVFLLGLENTLFPLGKLMAQQLTDPAFLYESAGKTAAVLAWHDYYWVYLFAAAIGFSTTLAEPALIAVSMKANMVSGGAIHVWGLRIAVAIGVGFGVSLGCYRIITGLPLHYFIAGGYLIVDCAAGLRFRWCYDVNGHGTFDHRARPGFVRSRPGTQRIA